MGERKNEQWNSLVSELLSEWGDRRAARAVVPMPTTKSQLLSLSPVAQRQAAPDLKGPALSTSICRATLSSSRREQTACRYWDKMAHTWQPSAVQTRTAVSS